MSPRTGRHSPTWPYRGRTEHIERPPPAVELAVVNDEKSGRSSRRGGRPSIGTLLVVRLLLIANALTLAAVAVLYLAYGARPASFFVGATLLWLAGVLACFLPFTDPYRPGHDARERHAPKR